jgi:hypothetical protein
MLECNLEVASKKLGSCALGKLSGFLDVKKHGLTELVTGLWWLDVDMWWTVVGTFGDWWKPWGEASLLLTEPSTSVTLSCLCAAREMPNPVCQQ